MRELDSSPTLVLPETSCTLQISLLVESPIKRPPPPPPLLQVFHLQLNGADYDAALLPMSVPFFDYGVPCGFPSPARDFEEDDLNLADFLIPHPHATFIVRASGTSMQGGEAQISHGDYLVVDCSILPANNQVVVAVLDGEFTVKRFRQTTKGGKVYLVADNPEFERPSIEVTEEMQFEVRGVVTYVIHAANRLVSAPPAHSLFRLPTAAAAARRGSR